MFCFEEEEEYEESDLPIDIPYSDLREWLQNRLFIPKDHLVSKMNTLYSLKKQGLEIMASKKWWEVEKMNALGEYCTIITSRVGDLSYLTYELCEKVFEVVKKYEKSFVFYSTEYKIWQKILNVYTNKKFNLFMVEKIATLKNYKKYLIPECKERIENTNKRSKSLREKILELQVKRAKNFEKYLEKCKELDISHKENIQGLHSLEREDIEKSLDDKISTVPEVWKRKIENLRSPERKTKLSKIIEYYLSFVEKVTFRDAIDEFDCVSTLRAFLKSDSVDISSRHDLMNEIVELSTFYSRRCEDSGIDDGKFVAESCRVLTDITDLFKKFDELTLMKNSKNFKTRTIQAVFFFVQNERGISAQITENETKISVNDVKAKMIENQIGGYEKLIINLKLFLEMVTKKSQ